MAMTNDRPCFEVQMDTLVGLTHHFGGHAKGNYASIKNRGKLSNPRQAALQGLQKMKFVMDQGVPQLVLPPQNRPHLNSLEKLGFKGKLQDQLEELYESSPDTLAKLCSSAFIWTANAATVFPSSDTQDSRVHLHIANLNSHFHREIEAKDRFELFKVIFSDTNFFNHHPPLSSSEYRDEGAANHTRFEGGYHLFVYGDPTGTTPGFEGIPRRQALASQRMMSMKSGLHENHVLYLQQSDRALKAGVFHNDVAAVGINHNYYCHEEAYRGGLNDLEKITTWYNMNAECEMNLVLVSQNDLSLEDAVDCYLFNTQWIQRQDGDVVILAPQQCENNSKAKKVIENWLCDQPNLSVEYFNLDQSMKNGGGPACLRLRLPLTQNEYDSIHEGIKLNLEKFGMLESWITKNYPEQFELNDVLNPDFRSHQDQALEELYQILDLPKHLLDQDHE